MTGITGLQVQQKALPKVPVKPAIKNPSQSLKNSRQVWGIHIHRHSSLQACRSYWCLSQVNAGQKICHQAQPGSQACRLFTPCKFQFECQKAQSQQDRSGSHLNFEGIPHSSPGRAPRFRISTTSRSPGFASFPALSLTAMGPLRWCTHVRSMFFMSSAESLSPIWPPVQSIVCRSRVRSSWGFLYHTPFSLRIS